MVQHILSIDFDYIMFPCIKLYNDLCGGGENSTTIWKIIEFGRGVDDKFISYDARSYTSIVKLVKAAIERDKNVKLIPIEEHQEIVDDLKRDENYNDTKYDLVNIDFHHDIFYRATDKNAIMHFDKYNCSDWVGYLILKDKIEKYTWVKAPNSDLYMHNLDGSHDIKFEIASGNIFDDIKSFVDTNTFDKVYLCFSPQWVPYKYKHLYDLIIDLFTPSTREE